jgi:hypothetical protein
MKVARERPIWRIVSLASQPRFVRALWTLVAYLLLLYAALRWGHTSPDRYPGSG